MSITKASGIIVIALSADDLTVGGLKSALSFGAQDYFTLVGINSAGAAEYCRFHINQSLADSTAIAAGNIDEVFELDGNATPAIALDGNNITITDANIAGCCAFIVTRHQNGTFIHSKAVLGAGTNLSYNADVALPTYPVGEQKFLNGGDQSFSPAPSVEPEPEPVPGTAHVLTISPASGVTSVNVTAGGASVNSGASVNAGVSLAISAVVAESGYHMEATINGNSITLTKNGTTYSGTATMPNADATITLTKVQDASPEPSEGRSLTVNGTTVTIGGSHTVGQGNNATIVLTLPADDPLIGKKMGYDNGEEAIALVQELVQGENTMTLQSSNIDHDLGTYVKAGVITSNQWAGDAVTLVTVE